MEATIKILALDSMVGDGFVYAKGGTYDAPESRARELVRAGLAEYAGSANTEIETAESVKAKTRVTRKK